MEQPIGDAPPWHDQWPEVWRDLQRRRHLIKQVLLLAAIARDDGLPATAALLSETAARMTSTLITSHEGRQQSHAAVLGLQPLPSKPKQQAAPNHDRKASAETPSDTDPIMAPGAVPGMRLPKKKRNDVAFPDPHSGNAASYSDSASVSHAKSSQTCQNAEGVAPTLRTERVDDAGHLR